MVIDAPPRGARRVPDSTLVRRLRSLSGRTEPTDAVVAVARGLVTAALCWQLLWFVVQPTLRPASQPSLPSAVALVAVIVVAFILLVSHLIGRRPWSGRVVRINVVVLLIATGVVNVSQLRSPEPDWHRVAELAAMAAGVVGLLLSTRWGLISTGVLTLLLVRDIILPGWSGQVQSSLSTVIDPFYVLAMGLSCVAAKRALLANAAAADDAATDLLRAEQDRRTADVVAERLRDTERRLHESVLNTLVALARGGLTAQWQGRIASRCEEGARLLESLGSRSAPTPAARRAEGSLEVELADIVADLRSAGVDVRWRAEEVDIPDTVHEALRTACAEALINVGRHAGASHVDIDVRARRARGRSGVRVRIRDDGCGLPTVPSGDRFGITDAIVGSMAEVGGTAVVHGTHGRHGTGTEVDLGWWSVPDSADDAGAALAPAPAALAVPVIVVLTLYASVILVVTRGLIVSPAVNAAAFAAWVGVSLLVVQQSRRGPLSAAVVVVVAAGGWLVYVLQASAASGGAEASWSSPAIAGLFLVVAATGPSWGWALLLVTWLVFQGDPLGELTQPGTAMILVGALLGRSLRRNARQAWENRSAELTEASVGRDARASIERIASRYRPLRNSSAPRLLRDVAEGRVDPGDPDLRAAAAREERFIRNVMRTDAADGLLHALALDLVVTAHARKALLDLDLAREHEVGPEVDTSALTCFAQAMTHACPTEFVDGRAQGTTARLTLRDEGRAQVLRLMVPMCEAPDVSVVPGSVSAYLVDGDDPAGEIWLWETAIRG